MFAAYLQVVEGVGYVEIPPVDLSEPLCFSLMAIAAVANRPGIKTLLDEGGLQETATEVNIDDAPIKTEVVDLLAVASNEDIVEQTDGPKAHLERAVALVEEGKHEQASKEYMIAGEF